ncbi:serine--tRNA ligase [Candidatus Marinamargulisbacteria bacterium SCGC AG-343-K17]|nr:serine--tRNA ligase [Candidatus Marinamargulisbacteria bacterium SCGC AG-343-K17]
MINPKLLRESPDVVKTSLHNRGCQPDVFSTLQALDIEWREKQQALEQLQALRNESVPKGKPSEEERQKLSELSQKLKLHQQDVVEIKEKLDAFSFEVPNILQSDTPVGEDESKNIVVRKEGTPRSFDFEAKTHDELATNLNLIDFDRATKVTGSRFATFTGLGAKLERALAHFMLDVHTQSHGYTEVSPPVIVNSAAMRGTGQLPKFEDDLYKVSEDYWLSPTAEVQLTNLHFDEIIPTEDLPIKYCAFTQCFRKEAGSYGKDMKGIIRLHQFNKVELVQLVSPEKSNDCLMELLEHAEQILKLLELPYRVVQLCSGDMGFSSSKTYDLEVWFPSQNQYREISSCSNFLDFQARRSKIRYRDSNQSVNYLHTLNGSGLAVGRTFAALLENYQTESGIIQIPNKLKDYLGIQEIGYEK